MSGVKNISIYESDTFDIYQNQAVELAIFSTITKDEAALFLWTNERTVVIGRNQDAYAECKVEQLEKENGHVARRLSGGGAVYHDTGNLNFTFFAREPNFDKAKNFEIIFSAMRACGFDVEFTGRNDLTVDGKKFSGNAYYKDGDRHYHHGTILIDADADALAKYLTPSREKLRRKAVSSVKSRVVNLGELNDGFDKIIALVALKTAFREAYKNAEVIQRKPSDLSKAELSKNLAHFSNREWILGRKVCYNLKCGISLDFGVCEVLAKLDCEKISDVRIITDSLETDRVERLEKLLVGKEIIKIADNVKSSNDVSSSAINDNVANSNVKNCNGVNINAKDGNGANSSVKNGNDASCNFKNGNDLDNDNIAKILRALGDMYEL